jgi:hypothetical protein
MPPQWGVPLGGTVHRDLFWEYSAQEPVERRDNEALRFSMPGVNEPEAPVGGVEGVVLQVARHEGIHSAAQRCRQEAPSTATKERNRTDPLLHAGSVSERRTKPLLDTRQELLCRQWWLRLGNYPHAVAGKLGQRKERSRTRSPRAAANAAEVPSGWVSKRVWTTQSAIPYRMS